MVKAIIITVLKTGSLQLQSTSPSMLSHFLKVVLLTGNVAFRSRHEAPFNHRANGIKLGCAYSTFRLRQHEPFLQGVKRTLIRPKGLFMGLFSWQLSACMKQDVNGIHSLVEALLPGTASVARGSCHACDVKQLQGGSSKPSHLLKFFCLAWKGSELAPGSLLLGQIQPDLAI